MARPSKVSNTKIALKDVGNPKVIATLPDTTTRHLLGTIVGIANGVKEAKGADGVTPVFGLKGNFEALPSDQTKPEVASGICYLPEAFMTPIIDALSDEVGENGEVTKEGASSIAFAFNVWVIRASNPQGYSWQLENLQAPAANDPLAQLRALTGKPADAQIEAPKGDKK